MRFAIKSYMLALLQSFYCSLSLRTISRFIYPSPGHSHGISSFIVPGAGEPNFDSFENNPFSNLRQRRETEVQTLLTKLAHDTIALGEFLVAVFVYRINCSFFSGPLQCSFSSILAFTFVNIFSHCLIIGLSHLIIFFHQTPHLWVRWRRTARCWRQNTRASSRPPTRTKRPRR